MSAPYVPARRNRRLNRRLSLDIDFQERSLSKISPASRYPSSVWGSKSLDGIHRSEALRSHTSRLQNTFQTFRNASTDGHAILSVAADIQPEGRESHRFSSVSGISDHYESVGGVTAGSSICEAHSGDSSLQERTSLTIGLSDAPSFPQAGPATTLTETFESPRPSNATVTDTVATDDTRTNYHTVLREVDRLERPTGGWPLGTLPDPNELQQNSRGQSDEPTAANTGNSTPILRSLPPIDSRIHSPSPCTPTFAKVPLLAKFFRPATPSEPPHVDEKGPPPPPKPQKSYFEDESDDGESIHIVQATQARVTTPMLVKHGSTAKVELKDMLRSTGPARDRSAPGPSKGKTADILGEDADYIKDSHREANIDMTEALNGDEPTQNADSKEGPNGFGLWKEINPFASANTATSQSLQPPTQSSKLPATLAAPHVRKVSFPLLNRLDIKSEHRFLRQSIVSTPYPNTNSRDSKKKKHAVKGCSSEKAFGKNGYEKGPVLTLVLYGHNNPYPKVKTMVIPTAQTTMSVNQTGNGKPPLVATLKSDFDDESLFKLVRSEYAAMRGSFQRLVSARDLRSINLLSFHAQSQLALHNAKPLQFRADDVQDEIAEARMLPLLLHPKSGRDHHEWTQWMAGLPHKSQDEGLEGDRIALELVEGLAPRRLYLAVAAVLGCSVLATSLWIFVGSSGTSMVRGGPGLHTTSSIAVGGQADDGFGATFSDGGAGGRVAAGAMLGLLVLMVGWTVIGAWVLLSWLVM